MILCCGEALIDMLPAPLGPEGDGFVPHCGGAVFNTAIALGRLGADAGLLTGLSRDRFGQKLAAALRASHVDASHVIASDRPSTLAFVHLTDGQASYSFHDNGSAGRMLTPDVMPPLGDGVAALFFGGISLACEPAADAYAALLAREGAGRAVMIDPNIRPAFVENEARYRARLADMFAEADIVKVSDEDLNWIAPGSSSLREKAGALLGAGAAIVILTCGAAGAQGFLANGREVHIAAQAAEVVDTVGAGDAFNAGVLAHLAARGALRKDRLRGLSADMLGDALAGGARVAAATVSRAGADPPWAGELKGGAPPRGTETENRSLTTKGKTP